MTKHLKLSLFYQLRLLTHNFKELRDTMILYSLFPFHFQSCTIPIHLKCDVFLPSFCLRTNLSFKIFPLFFILPFHSEMVMEIGDISSKHIFCRTVANENFVQQYTFRSSLRSGVFCGYWQVTKCHSLVHTAAVKTAITSATMHYNGQGLTFQSSMAWQIHYSGICAVAILFFNILQKLPYQNLCAF